MTDARLGFQIDSSQADKAVADLDALVGASQRAEGAAKKLGQASQTTGSGLNNAGAAASSAASKVSAGSGLIDRFTAAWNRLLGVLGRTFGASGRASQALQQTAENAAKSASSIKFNTANIAAQFQDIGVTAAMGMNPLNIALQQGTQLAGVMATMENPLKGIGAGLLSLISPVSILTIGMVALVAAGLQFVKWGQVAKSSLNAVADSLVTIAPYAALAAGGLALLYAPSVVMGLVSLVLNLGKVATAVWGIATAIYATVGLPVLLVAGFVAIVAAAVVWRDELTKMLGFDIVEAAQKGVNWIIGAFVGAYNSIKDVWGLLPGVFADIFTEAMNGAIDIVQNGINGIIGGINGLLAAVHLPTVEQANLQQFKGTVSGAASQAGGIISRDMAAAQGADYVSNTIKVIQSGASAAADKLRALADGIDLTGKNSKKAAKAAAEMAQKYQDIVRGAQQHIDASKLEAQTLGMTTEEINAQKYSQELLNKAADDHIKLTSKQRDELTGLGKAMAVAEAATQKLKDAYAFAKDVFKGFFSDFKTNLENGEGWFQSFADAGINALNKILDKFLDLATSQIFDNLLKIGGGGGGSNFLSSLFGLFSANGTAFGVGGRVEAFASGGVVNRPTMFRYGGGLGLMGEAGPEAIVPLRRGPDGKLGVGAGGSAPVDVRVGVTVDNDGNLQAYVKSVSQQTVSAGLKAYDAKQPERVHRKALKAIHNPTAAINQW